MQLHAKRRGVSPPYFSVLALETGILAVLSLLPATTADILFTTSIAFAASVQVQTFREVDGHSYNSTFTTGNLRTLAEAAVGWFQEGHKQADGEIVKGFSVICAAFLAGAMAGAYTVQRFGNRALWCDVVLLALIASRVQYRRATIISAMIISWADPDLLPYSRHGIARKPGSLHRAAG